MSPYHHHYTLDKKHMIDSGRKIEGLGSTNNKRLPSIEVVNRYQDEQNNSSIMYNLDSLKKKKKTLKNLSPLNNNKNSVNSVSRVADAQNIYAVGSNKIDMLRSPVVNINKIKQ